MSSDMDETQCRKCGGLNGNHGFVHERYGNGGGGNKPCPNTPAPTTEGEQGTEAFSWERIGVIDPGSAQVESTWSMTFVADPASDEVWAALFGDEPPTWSMTLNIPARRRTVWEWLTRKPRHHAQTVYMPNVRVTETKVVPR